MGGTIASGGSAPMLSPVTWAGTAAYGSASDAGVIGGGPTPIGVAMPQPTLLPQTQQPMLSYAAPAPQPQPQPQPAVTTPAPTADIAAALANLVKVLNQLVGILQAQAGAGGVQGGGGAGMAGCSCHGGGAGVAQSATQAGGANAAPDAAVQESKSDKPRKGTGGGGGGGGAAPTAGTSSAPAPASGSVREKIVATAREELAKNVKEDAGSNKDSGGNIRKYRTAVTGPGENPDDAESWCADFASWLWKEAGVPWGPEGKGDDYTVTMVDLAKKTGTWKTQDPQPGDMVFIDWDGGEDVDHVAVVEKVENGKVYTIAGNESDSVKAASYAIGDPKMMGFVSPKGA
jgi:hypothetical protein